MSYFFLLMAMVLNAAANTMMKMGATKVGVFKEYGLWQGLLKNYIVLVGIALFALNVIFYILALSKINLSIAYPIMTTGGLLLITTISYLFFKETITGTQMAGIGLLISGIILISSSS